MFFWDVVWGVLLFVHFFPHSAIAIFGGPSRAEVAEKWNAAVTSESGCVHQNFYDKMSDDSAVRQYFSDTLQGQHKSKKLEDEFFQSFSKRSHKIIQQSSPDHLQAHIAEAYGSAEYEGLDTTMWKPSVYRLLVYLTNLEDFHGRDDKTKIWMKLINAAEMKFEGEINSEQKEEIKKQLDQAEEIFWAGGQKPGFRADADRDWIDFKKTFVP